MLSLNTSLPIAARIATNDTKESAAIERLSSGLRINRASDDASGLTIAEGMRAQVKGTQQAARNIQDAINTVQIGEGAVQGMFPIMQRMRELVVRAGNSTNSSADLQDIQDEIDQIKNLIPEAFDAAHQFRLKLDGNPSDRILDFQVGADRGQVESVDYNPLHDTLLTFTLDSFGYSELYGSKFNPQLESLFGKPLPLPTSQAPAPFPPGVTLDQAFPKKLLVNPNTPLNMQQAFNTVDTATGGLSQQAGYFGACINKLGHQLNNVTNYDTQVSSSESKIRDADMADEMVAKTRAEILKNSTTALFSAANSRQETLLTLITGRQ
ncbi:MAG: flagellin [Cyanobacteria bacterium RYN_339]|nr:flagellin [Cyanobacteria bacterium RYN_339]